MKRETTLLLAVNRETDDFFFTKRDFYHPVYMPKLNFCTASHNYDKLVFVKIRQNDGKRFEVDFYTPKWKGWCQAIAY